MKRLIALVLVGMMLLSTAAYADAAAGSSGEAIELTVWCWTQDFNLYAIREANKIYQADHPNVNVTPVEVPWDEVQSKLIAALSSKQYDALPDIVLMQDSAAQKNIITYPDAFYDLTDKVDFSNFAPYKVSCFTVGGRTYGVPFDSGACAQFLRRDVLEKAGLTLEEFNGIDWDQFIEKGIVIKEKTGMPILSLQQGSLSLIDMMLQSSNEWYFNEDGQPNIANNKALRAAIDIIKRMEDAGIVENVVDWNEYSSGFVNGKIAGCVNAAWMISILTAAKDQSGLWGAANFPKMPGFANSRNGASNGGSSWMVLKSSPNADAAVDFLDKTFNGSVKFYETILETSGAIATWAPAAESPVYKAPMPFFANQAVYTDILKWSEDIPPITNGIYLFEAQAAVSKAYEDIRNGADVDDALQVAQETIEFLMD